MNAKLSILFYAKRAKTTTDGLVPIYIRVTIDGERIELSTKRYTLPEKWSIEGSCMKGSSAEAKSINSYLDSLKAKHFGINLYKGILLTGPIGCGKTSLMQLMRVLIPPQQRFGIKSCREITFDFIKDGYEIIQRYSSHILIALMTWTQKAPSNTTAIASAPVCGKCLI